MSVKSEVWKYLLGNIKNEIGVAALMGNLQAESGIDPNNTQNSYEKSLGMKNEEYTAAVDSGKYTKFTTDRVGYGLAQWTSSGRKANLLTYAKSRGGSVGSLEIQLEFLYLELKNNYKSVLAKLEAATSLTSASTVVLKDFESPANQSASVQQLRASYGLAIYNELKSSVPIEPTPVAPTPTPTPTPVGNNEPLNYIAGKNYTIQASSLVVREKPIEKNGAVIKGDRLGASLKKGTVVTNQATMLICGEIWMFIGMSGTHEKWICAYNGDTYVS